MTNDNHSQSKPLLSIIMPVYNERDTISAIIKLVRAVPLSKEIIVIDDGSTDGTQEVLKSMTGDDLVLLLQEKNAGKGAAIRVGIPHVSGEIAIIQDADTEYDPQDYHALIKPIQEGKAEVVYGSRFLMPEAIEQGSRKLRWPSMKRRSRPPFGKWPMPWPFRERWTSRCRPSNPWRMRLGIRIAFPMNVI